MTWKRTIHTYIGRKLFLTLKHKYKFLGFADDDDCMYLTGPIGGFVKYMDTNYMTTEAYYKWLREYV
jgi:hypothetical protein